LIFILLIGNAILLIIFIIVIIYNLHRKHADFENRKAIAKYFKNIEDLDIKFRFDHPDPKDRYNEYEKKSEMEIMKHRRETVYKEMEAKLRRNLRKEEETNKKETKNIEDKINDLLKDK
jgi:hypothetical protein